MLLIFSERPSPRLQYICQYLFAERMQVSFRITSSTDEFNAHDGPAICYAPQAINTQSLHISHTALLFETAIRPQCIDMIEWEGLPAFFDIANADLPFDLFSAAFFLLSRYEEYLPHTNDSYGRYPHNASLAYRSGFLKQPLIDQWMMKLVDMLQQRFPSCSIKLPAFKVLPTYDIDIAWSYLHKGWWRNTGAWLKSPSFERLAVLAGQRRDPFDVYDWLDDFHAQAGIRPRYFFLLAAKNNRYDKNINGFRASVAAPFYWYDLEQDTITSLKVHPFCFMDANAFYEEKLNTESALTEMISFERHCEAVKGTMITIWHNNFLGPDARYKGWREVYEKWIRQLSSNVFCAD